MLAERTTNYNFLLTKPTDGCTQTRRQQVGLVTLDSPVCGERSGRCWVTSTSLLQWAQPQRQYLMSAVHLLHGAREGPRALWKLRKLSTTELQQQPEFYIQTVPCALLPWQALLCVLSSHTQSECSSELCDNLHHRSPDFTACLIQDNHANINQ